MAKQHWAVSAMQDISDALPEDPYWVARQHLKDAIEAIRAIHEAELTSDRTSTQMRKHPSARPLDQTV